ncbi:MAG: hypothetical protein HY716_00390 [Planctomycetes bacterium]|nr:hypothetical protein [Planctomycetota bacterium]
MPRFTIARHDVSEKTKNHFDLFLEREQMLKSWRLHSAEFEEPQKAFEARDHKLKYLDFEGPLSDNRGDIAIWDTGLYLEDLWSPTVVQVALRGKKVRTRLRLSLDRNAPEPGVWTLEDTTPRVRRLAASFLREPTPDPPPTPDLERIADGLVREEQHLVLIVNQFLQAAPVEWSRVALDEELHGDIRRALARWRHPWLEAAHHRAERLDEMARAVMNAKPPRSS